MWKEAPSIYLYCLFLSWTHHTRETRHSFFLSRLSKLSQLMIWRGKYDGGERCGSGHRYIWRFSLLLLLLANVYGYLRGLLRWTLMSVKKETFYLLKEEKEEEKTVLGFQRTEGICIFGRYWEKRPFRPSCFVGQQNLKIWSHNYSYERNKMRLQNQKYV